MIERGILVSAPMVKAILAGTKTQTRRALRPQPPDNACPPGWRWQVVPGGTWAPFDTGSSRRAFTIGRCRYGTPGDRLWVRETCSAFELPDGLDVVRYVADGGTRPIEDTEAAAEAWVKLNHYGGRGKGHVVPAIHMPRWASRITLEVTEVRVERLRAISEADAQAEGANDATGSHREHYAAIWAAINGPGAWDANPWVWAVSFRRIT